MDAEGVVKEAMSITIKAQDHMGCSVRESVKDCLSALCN